MLVGMHQESSSAFFLHVADYVVIAIYNNAGQDLCAHAFPACESDVAHAQEHFGMKK